MLSHWVRLVEGRHMHTSRVLLMLGAGVQCGSNDSRYIPLQLHFHSLVHSIISHCAWPAAPKQQPQALTAVYLCSKHVVWPWEEKTSAVMCTPWRGGRQDGCKSTPHKARAARVASDNYKSEVYIAFPEGGGSNQECFVVC